MTETSYQYKCKKSIQKAIPDVLVASFRTKGFPDLVFFYNDLVLFAEFKAHKGKLRSSQNLVIPKLRNCLLYTSDAADE